MREQMELDADLGNLGTVLDQIESLLQKAGWGQEQMVSVIVAAEEIFVNIARYAYHPETGKVTIEILVDRENHSVELVFFDSGRPFNPLEKADPDLELAVEDREPGGLGIFMVKKMMDEVRYVYEDGKNKFIMKKRCIEQED